MNSITDLCFLCTKDYNCVAVDDKIICEVKYTLPEIINITFSIPLHICSVCNEALYAFSKFKQISVDNILRLEARIKGAPGPLQHTGNSHIAGSGETSHIKPENIEQIIIKEEPLEPTTRGPQLHTNRASPDPGPQLQTPGAPNIQQQTHTQQLHKVEEIFIKVEERAETPQDQEFNNNIQQDTLKEECDNNNDIQSEHNTENKMATQDTTKKTRKNSSSGAKEKNIKKKNAKKCNKNKLINHTGTSNSFLCCVCKKRFLKEDKLKHHLELHKDIKDFFCGSCNEPFSFKTYLENHITHSCRRVKKMSMCSVCNKTFKYKCLLDRHMKNHKRKIEMFPCTKCKMSFKYKCYWERHMKYHTGIKDFQCDKCEKSFAFKNNLLSHKRIHEEVKEYKCKICDTSFTLKVDLVKHMRFHIKVFRCDTCNNSYVSNSDLILHMKNHTITKNFKCEICGKLFLYEFSLAAHLKSHSFYDICLK